jgi:HEAT repeat protein
MNTSTIITTIGLLLGGSIAIGSIPLYILVYSKKRTFLRLISLVNFIVFLSMVGILVGVVSSILTAGRFALNSLPIPSVLSAASVGIILLFIIGQAIYFLTPFSPLRDKSALLPSSDQEVERPDAEKIRDEAFERTYREKIRLDVELNTIQIMGMKEPLEVEETYVQRKLSKSSPDTLKKNQFNDPDSDNLDDPDQLLEKEEDSLELWFMNATDDVAAINDSNYLIVGDPGIGKTTFMKYLALRETEKLSLYVDLNNFAIKTFTRAGSVGLSVFKAEKDKAKYLLDFITEKHSKWYSLDRSEIEKCIRRNLQKGNVLLLLDGLDETLVGRNGKEAQACYDCTCAIITTLAKNSKAQIIVTSRDAAYDEYPVLKEFQKLYLSGFSAEQRKTFVKKWFAGHPELPAAHERESGLLTRLRQSRCLRSLAANPLFLAIQASLYDPQSEMPERRAELYEQCVDALLYNWDSSRGKSRQYDVLRSEKEHLLKEIAWHFYKDGKHFFHENELLEVTRGFLLNKNFVAQSAEEVLEEITTRYGLLKKIDQDYLFLHLNFQEYFVAQKAKEQQADSLQTLLDHVCDLGWEEVINLYIAYTSREETLQDALGVDIFCTNLLLVGCAVAAADPAKRRSTSHSRKAIADLLSELRETRYKSLRKDVAETLAKIGGSDVYDELITVCEKEDNTTVQKSIIGALAKYGEKQVAGRLAEMLLNHDIDLLVRRDIANALAWLGDASVVPTLRALFSNPSLDLDLRLSISRTLSKLGDASIVSDLLDLLTDPKLDEDIGVTIAEAVGLSGTVSAVPHLLMLLSRKADSGQEENGSVESESSRRNANQQDAHSQEISYQLTIRIRQAIVVALYRLDKNQTETPLHFRSLLADKRLEWPVRACITILLGVGEERPMLASAVQPFADKEIPWPVRKRLVDFLLEINAYPLAPVLVPLLGNKQIEPDIRASLARVLGRLSNQSSERRNIVRELSKYMLATSIDRRVRSSIIYALETMKEKSVIQNILDLLAKDNEKREVLESCADFLITHHIYIEDVKKPIDILHAIKNKAEKHARFDYERTDIVILLGTLGDQSVLGELEELLLSPRLRLDARRCKGLTDALGKVGDDSTVKRLREIPSAYWMPNLEMRQNVFEVLKLLTKDEETCRILGRCLVYPSEFVDDIYETLHVISVKRDIRIFEVFDSSLPGQITDTSMEHIEVEHWHYKRRNPRDLFPVPGEQELELSNVPEKIVLSPDLLSGASFIDMRKMRFGYNGGI